MPKTDRCVVVAVCGSPGAGKSTVAAAVAAHLGVPLLARDEIKAGLGLSSAASADDATVRIDPDFFVAGGPFSRRAEAAMVQAARVLASSGVGLVVESSVLSRELLDGLHECQARVLAVHVVADEAVVGARLRVRAAKGWAVDEQMAAAFERGDMERAKFAPPRRRRCGHRGRHVR
ncbi:AAA family ATPase [Actinoplanes couchii]|uniref:UDP-N-acetylglucosamine kinase n=1 Tax=Actinoplanes couchii TaxID=403638 RepID=A0ABQ3XSL7_9ACTN|nr:AAA family ATPase [Actinoplanes couchii]MDR6318568.1 putative kinase [Actinoplanes couchii]GID61499.1 hypothetical protein Aco03nite_099030 [Actinoplanes couchii]